MTAHDLHLLDPTDNVAVVLRDLAPGETVDAAGASLTVVDAIPRGHKIAVAPIAAGDVVTKYGHVIGEATTDIAPGEHVHEHNLAFVPLAPGAQAAGTAHAASEIELPQRRTFMGYRRSDGRVGTRNDIVILSTVNCSATVVRAIAGRAEASGLLDEFPGIDAIVPITHDSGCGLGGPDGIAVLRRTLAGYATHPNVAGVVVVGLGCEMNLMEGLLDGLTFRPEVPVARFTIQDTGGTKASVQHGLDEVRRIAALVDRTGRVEVPVSELVVGLNCGGSDGWSGVTANPALGWASDAIVAQGGTTVLAETPEIYGAEDLLLRRATTPELADALVARLRWWEEYTASAGGSMDNNPSPGNKAGGITTILEKSLGSVAKGGHAPWSAFYDYAAPIDHRGLGFMDTPGYDPVSVTGLVAGGANVVVFTTGRGSAIGSRPAPTIKVATNSDLARRMAGDMDVDAGDIVEQGVSVADKGREIYDLILDVASGRLTSSEELGYGDNEFVPWHLGATT